MDNRSECLRAAHWYARRGWMVLPLHSVDGGKCSCKSPDCSSVAKHPLAFRGVLDATKDLGIIDRWWAKWPHANVAVATGRISGIVVLDVDPRHGGEDSLDDLQRKHGKLPDTVEAITGGGGRHLVFLSPDTPLQNSAGHIGPGLDFKADGGYIVAPPSVHASGISYHWEGSSRPDEIEPAPLPSWLLERVQSGTQRAIARSASEWQELVSKGVGEGQRNQSIASLAGHLLARGVKSSLAHELLQAWNTKKCQPPLSSEEVSQTVGSITRREQDRRKGRAIAMGDDLPDNVVMFPKKPNQPKEVDEKQVEAMLEALRQAEDPGIEALKAENLAVISAMSERLDVFGAQIGEVHEICKKKLPLLRSALKQCREGARGRPGMPRGVGGGSATIRELIPDAPVTEDHVVPPGWILCDDSGVDKPSLFREVPSKQAGGEPTFVPVCRWPVVMTTRIQNATTGNAMLEVAWKEQGVWHRIVAERTELMDAAKIVACTGGRNFPVSSEDRKHLVAYLAAYRNTNGAVMPLQRVSAQMGWFSPRSLLTGVGLTTNDEKEKAEAVEFCALNAGEEQLGSAVRPRGSFKKWCEAIATVSEHPRVMLGVYASLAAPLLEPLDLPGFVIDWSYRTSTGKSVVLRTAASVWGNPNDHKAGSLVRTWNTTQVGFERHATALRNLPVILDDTKTARRPQIVADILYQAAAGQGRTRGAITGSRKTASWCTILLSSGERKATDFTKDAGSVVRCLALWGPPFDENSKAVASKIAALEEVIFENHGHAGPRFIEWFLRQDMAEIKKRYKELRSMLSATLSEKLDAAVASRVGYSAAVVELAGRLVHEALALPWRYESPWCTLLSSAVEALADVDRAKQALEVTYSWAVERQEWFYGKRQETIEDPGRATEYVRAPAPRWAGAWREDYLAFTGTTLKEVLETNGFEFDPIVRQWDERGWLATSRGHRTKLVKISGGPVRCYVLNPVALGELTSG